MREPATTFEAAVAALREVYSGDSYPGVPGGFSGPGGMRENFVTALRDVAKVGQGVAERASQVANMVDSVAVSAASVQSAAAYIQGLLTSANQANDLALGQIAAAVEGGLGAVGAVSNGVAVLRDQAAQYAASAAASASDVTDMVGAPPLIDFRLDDPAGMPPGVVLGMSGKWVTGPSGLLTYAPAGTPAIEYDPTTGEAAGLLVEEARTNLLRYSDSLSASSWGRTALAVTGAAAAPDGTASAVLAARTATNAYTNHSATFSAGTYALSVYARAGSAAAGDEVALLMMPAYGARAGAIFNLRAGTVRTAAASTAGGSQLIRASIEPAGGDWWRCALVASVPAGAGHVYLAPTDPSQWSLDPFGGVPLTSAYFWGAQLEAGPAVSSYIPSLSATVTRAADVNTLALSRVPGWSAQEGTVYVEAESGAATPGFPSPWELCDGSTNNLVRVTQFPSLAVRGTVISGVVEVASIATGAAPALGTPYRAALAWRADDVAACVDGGAVGVDVSAAIPTLTQMRIGLGFGGALNCHIKRLCVWPRRLPDAALQAITE